MPRFAQPSHTLPILLIAAGLLLWGVIHAAGAYRYNYHPGRALIVFGAVLGFLVFWFLLLLWRARHPRRGFPKRESRTEESPSETHEADE